MLPGHAYCAQLWLCVSLTLKVFTLRTSAAVSRASAFFCCGPTSAFKKVLTQTASQHTTIHVFCLHNTPRSQSGSEETNFWELTLNYKSKTALPPNLATYLVEVIFIIRETFKQKATCNRKENLQMQKTRCWQELSTR